MWKLNWNSWSFMILTTSLCKILVKCFYDWLWSSVVLWRGMSYHCTALVLSIVMSTYFLSTQNSQSSCTDATSLARLGTYSLEWTYLSNITGDPQYYEKVSPSYSLNVSMSVRPTDLYMQWFSVSVHAVWVWRLHLICYSASGSVPGHRQSDDVCITSPDC